MIQGIDVFAFLETHSSDLVSEEQRFEPFDWPFRQAVRFRQCGTEDSPVNISVDLLREMVVGLRRY